MLDLTAYPRNRPRWGNLLAKGGPVRSRGSHGAPTGGHTAIMLALAAGLLLGAPFARADLALAHGQQTVEETHTDRVRVQPTARQFAPPNQPDVSASAAREIDALYRQLISPKPATPSASGKSMLFGQQVEDRIVFLKTALKITPAQETEWAILAAAMRENAKTLDRATMLARQQPLPVAATRLRAVREVFDKVQDENDARLRAALRPFYARLSTEQQKVANELFDVQRQDGRLR